MKFLDPEDEIFGVNEACRYLRIKGTRFSYLVAKYQIPHYNLACGRIFFKSDLRAFQEGRKDRLKHRRNKHK